MLSTNTSYRKFSIFLKYPWQHIFCISTHLAVLILLNPVLNLTFHFCLSCLVTHMPAPQIQLSITGTIVCYWSTDEMFCHSTLDTSVTCIWKCNRSLLRQPITNMQDFLYLADKGPANLHSQDTDNQYKYAMHWYVYNLCNTIVIMHSLHKQWHHNMSVSSWNGLHQCKLGEIH